MKYYINLFFIYSFYTNSAHGNPCKNSFLFIIHIAYIMSIIIIKVNVLDFFSLLLIFLLKSGTELVIHHVLLKQLKKPNEPRSEKPEFAAVVFY